MLVFPTWRVNGDGGLVRAIEALVAAQAVVAIPVEVGPRSAAHGDDAVR